MKSTRCLLIAGILAIFLPPLLVCAQDQWASPDTNSTAVAQPAAPDIAYQNSGIPFATVSTTIQERRAIALTLKLEALAGLESAGGQQRYATQDIELKLVHSSEMATNLQKFYDLESASGAKLTDLRQPSLKTVSDGQFLSVVFLVSAEGTIEQLRKFVAAVERGPMVARIRDFSITSASGTAGTVSTNPLESQAVKAPIPGDIKPASAPAIAQIESSKNPDVPHEVHTVSNDELVSLLGQDIPVPEKTDIPFLSLSGKIAAVYPAGYSALNVSSDQVNIVSPSKDLIFVVSCVKTGIFGRSLESMVGEMLNSVQSQFPGAEISKVVSSTLAGVDARAFAATIVVDGSVKQRIFVFGVIGKRLLSVSMYAPVDKALEGLGVFRRICAAYKYVSE
jgi:hypothetical protein